MTISQFRKQAVAAFRKANSGAAKATINWTRCDKVDRWADGSSGFSGTFTVTCEGYRSRSMTATYSPTFGLMVR